MQTLLKLEMLSKKVKKDFNIIITAVIAVVNAKINPLNILKSVREANKASSLLDEFREQANKPNDVYNLRDDYLFFENRLIMSDKDRLRVKLLNVKGKIGIKELV
jgi:hypothetical protein